MIDAPRAGTRCLLALAFGLAACSRAPVPNVLLISIDTLRADYLSCYGFPEKTTPHIDALAQSGIRFANAYSPVPLTLPAHSSLLTGTLPPVHGMHDNLSYRLGDSRTTLAEALRQAGFTTGAIVSSFVLDARFNLSQGFDSYHDDFEEEHTIAFLGERKGGETTRLARAWLEANRDERFFLFLHYYDPHDDYDPPPPHDARFPGDPYAGEVAFVDQGIGEVVETLRDLDLFDSTIIVVTSDHGEMLGEHGEPTHGYFIYQSAVRVPLIFRVPGLEPRVVEAPVGLVDVAPTIASLSGAELPSGVQGVDLSPLLRGAERGSGRRELYVESLTPSRYYGINALYGVVTDRWKYIHTTRPELYDLLEDPRESRNVVQENPRLAAGFRRSLERFLSASTPASATPSSLDEDAMKRLAALGYLGGATETTLPGLESDREDPKDWIDFFRDHQKLERLVNDARYDEAQALAEAMLRDTPAFVGGHFQLARIAAGRGELDRARSHYEKALGIEPENKLAHFHLAETLRRLGETELALEHYQKVVELDPEFAEANVRLGEILVKRGELDRATAHLQEVLRTSPETVEARIQLGLALAQSGALDEALAAFRRAVTIEPDRGEAHFHLASLLARQGKLEEAVTHFRRALEAAPDSAEVHHRLGLVLREQGKSQEALEHLEKAVALDPGLALAHNNLGLALKEMGRVDEALEHYRRALQLDPELAVAHNNLGGALAARGEIREALAHFRRAVASDPENEEARNNLGLALRMTGARDEAVPHFRAALAGRPDWPEPMNELAWILATHPEPGARNPEEALRLARRAAELTGGRDPIVLDTLAAAHAANGDFENAVAEAERALSIAPPGLAGEIRARLELYRQQKPFREAARTLAAPPR